MYDSYKLYRFQLFIFILTPRGNILKLFHLNELFSTHCKYFLKIEILVIFRLLSNNTTPRLGKFLVTRYFYLVTK